MSHQSLSVSLQEKAKQNKEETMVLKDWLFLELRARGMADTTVRS